MRIDLLITELDVGGAERCLVGLARFLAEQGDKVRVISLGPKSPPGRTQLIDQLVDAGIETHFLNGYSSLYFPLVLKRLRKLVDADRPNVAQSFLFHANVAASFAYPFRDIPWFAGVRVAEPRRWRHPIGGWVARSAQKVVCVSESVADWCHRCEKIPRNKLSVIPNGVAIRTVDKFAIAERIRQQFDIPTENILLFVGRLDKQKGVDELIARSTRILDDLSDHRIVIVGDGPLEPSVRSITHPRFHYVGWQPNPRDWMAISKMLLLPTRYEGMPNVVLEAMAEGIPVATMNVEGIEEVLKANPALQIASHERWDDWENLVCKLARSDRLDDIGMENQKTVATHFQSNAMLAKYRGLYTRDQE